MSNVFKFVKVRSPQFTRPAPVDPLIMHSLVALIESEPPDSTVPIPIPMIFDPVEERRFMAGMLDPANVDDIDRDEALRRRAMELLTSERYVINDPTLANLISLEGAFRSVVTALGPELPADPAARWVVALSRLFEANVTQGAPLVEWVARDDFQRVLSSIWQSFYAQVLVGNDRHRSDRVRLVFWLRLFIGLRQVFAGIGDSPPIVFARMKLGLPAILAPRVENTRPRPVEDDSNAIERARRARLAEISREIAGLEAVSRELKEIDRRFARAPVKTQTGSPPKERSSYSQPPKPRPPGEDEMNEFESFLLQEDSLPAEMANRLRTAGIAFVCKSVDAVSESIDEAVEALESEDEVLRSRHVLAVRDGVLIRRTLLDDRPGEDE